MHEPMLIAASTPWWLMMHVNLKKKCDANSWEGYGNKVGSLDAEAFLASHYAEGCGQWISCSLNSHSMIPSRYEC